MPLLDSASPKARDKNIETEVTAKEAQGYSPKKAAQIASAIGYRIQRRAAAKEGHR